MVDDSLKADPGERYDMVLTNPPFGKKSSMTVVNAEGETEREDLVVVRDDFWASTSNKQLNFVQHVKTLLKIRGSAAVVVPDNVLFEGGAGETVRRKLLNECDVHTLLRLPTGIFYAQGVKANVLFFDRKPASEGRRRRRSGSTTCGPTHFTLKQNPLRAEQLEDFVRAYNPGDRRERVESERFRPFSYDELLQRDKVSLDLIWLRDESLEDSENLPPPTCSPRRSLRISRPRWRSSPRSRRAYGPGKRPRSKRSEGPTRWTTSSGRSPLSSRATTELKGFG